MSLSFTLNWSAFLTEYWQKRPTVIRSGFIDFTDPISADELAGLAMEEQVDSRLVAHHGDQWQVEHGPFTDFERLGEKNWSLLVQAVDHWLPQVAELMDPFRVLPNWRLDDLMISFSVPGGGVGPHLDQYDVFIIQGMGKRRWRVGEKQPMPQHCPHPNLLQVDPFDPILDVELEPGDILYIPPGFPHDGYALEPSLNYSIGFRAPNQRELFSSFADQLLADDSGNLRYTDPDLQQTTAPGAIHPQEVQRLRDLMQELLLTPEFEQWLANYLSQPRHELDLQPVEPAFNEGDVYDRLQEGGALWRLGGLRAFYLHSDPTTCFMAGERLPVPQGGTSLAQMLCDNTRLDADSLLAYLDDPVLLAWLTMLLNSGYWYFASDWDEESDSAD